MKECNMNIVGSIAVKTSLSSINYNITNKSNYLEYLTTQVSTEDSLVLEAKYNCEDFNNATFSFYFGSELFLPSGYAIIRILGEIDYVDSNQQALLDKLVRNEHFLKFLDENITKFKERFNDRSQITHPANTDFVYYDHKVLAEINPSKLNEVNWIPLKLLDNCEDIRDVEFRLAN